MLGKPAHIVGHSYGGAVALQFASRHPRYVKTLTLIEPASFHLLRDGDDIDERGFREISETGTTVVNALNCGDYQGGMRRFVAYWGGEGAWNALPASQQLALAARISKVALGFWATPNDPTGLNRDAAPRCVRWALAFADVQDMLSPCTHDPGRDPANGRDCRSYASIHALQRIAAADRGSLRRLARTPRRA